MVAGVKRVVDAHEMPLKQPSLFRELVDRSSQVILVGSSLHDLQTLLAENKQSEHLADRIRENGLRFLLATVDPEWRDYVSLRGKEIDRPGWDTQERTRAHSRFFAQFKRSLMEKTVDRRGIVGQNLFVGRHRLLPRAAIMSFDKIMYVRFYTGVHRGGEATFGLELEAGSDTHQTYQREQRRYIDDAKRRMLEVRDGSGHSWPELREIAHSPALELQHDVVHLIAVQGTSLVLQLRAESRNRNPLRWTSVVSGHKETGDETLEQALVREAREELGIELRDLVLRGQIRKVGSIDTRSVGGGSVCTARSHLFLGWNLPLDAAQVTDEVARVQAFPLRKVLGAMSANEALDGFLFADNFPEIGWGAAQALWAQGDNEQRQSILKELTHALDEFTPRESLWQRIRSLQFRLSFGPVSVDGSGLLTEAERLLSKKKPR